MGGRQLLGVVVALAVVAAACSGDDGGGGGGGADDAVTGAEGFVDEAALDDREAAYLDAVATELDPTSPLSVIAHAERAERQGGEVDLSAVTPDAFAEEFAKIDGFEDTADFDMLYLLNLWSGYRDLLPEDTVAAIEERFLGFKYWYTEPTPAGEVDNRYYWSENHRIIFHTLEYLAGQAFPDATFTNDGRTGAEHRDQARERILTWLDEKVRLGFSEWHSDTYYQKDVTPLLTLVEWAEDPEITERAAMVLDLVLFDVASHLQNGYFGASRGRSYMKDKSRAPDQDVFGLAKLLFDDTDQPYPGVDPGATLFARAERYRLPEVIRRVAVSEETGVDRQRMGVPLDIDQPVSDDPEDFGYPFDDPASVDFWWERGAQTAWQVVPLTIDTLDRHDLWESEFFAPFAPLRDLVGDDDAAAQDLARSLSATLGFGLLTEVNSYTYRSPDVLLSTAQDHRPGVHSDQIQSWVAALDEDAIVFTTHPKDEPERGTEWPDSDGYWTGTGSTPRSAQHETAAIHLYDPQYTPGPPLDLGYTDYTHAYFPQERFDEVVQQEGWTIGRRGDGYVALWSQRPAEFRTHPPAVFTHGLTEPFDLVAEGGADNVWIVEVGDAATSGTFDEFVAAVTGAAIEVGDDLAVTYESPSQGTMTFGWADPFTVDGEEVALDGYPRIDNPWATVDAGAEVYEITDGDASLTLDFTTSTRTPG